MKEQPRGLARTSARRFHAPAPIKNRDLSLVSVLGENHAGSGHPRSPAVGTVHENEIQRDGAVVVIKDNSDTGGVAK